VKYELLTKEVGLTLEEFQVFGFHLVKRAIESGLSVVAIDKVSKEMAGVSLCLSP
jgi:hypothetical protein